MRTAGEEALVVFVVLMKHSPCLGLVLGGQMAEVVDVFFWDGTLAKASWSCVRDSIACLWSSGNL